MEDVSFSIFFILLVLFVMSSYSQQQIDERSLLFDLLSMDSDLRLPAKLEVKWDHHLYNQLQALSTVGSYFVSEST